MASLVSRQVEGNRQIKLFSVGGAQDTIPVPREKCESSLQMDEASAHQRSIR